MTLAQVNSSTIKASYNNSTGKAQAFTIPPCEFCSVTPDKVSVTFSDVVIADGCGTCATSTDISWQDIPDINGTYTLFQDTSSPCVWEFTDTPTPGIKRIWQSSDGTCVGGGTSSVLRDFLIQLRKTSASQVRLTVQFSNVLIFDSNTYTATSNCVNVTDEPNDLVDDFCNGGWDGTATVTEI